MWRYLYDPCQIGNIMLQKKMLIDSETIVIVLGVSV